MKTGEIILLVVLGVVVIGGVWYSSQSQGGALTRAQILANQQAQAALKTSQNNLAATQSNNSPLGIVSNLAGNLDLSGIFGGDDSSSTTNPSTDGSGGYVNLSSQNS